MCRARCAHSGFVPQADTTIATVSSLGLLVNTSNVNANPHGSPSLAKVPVDLRNQVTLNKGAVEQSNFDDYEPTCIREMPKVELHIVRSSAAPSGIGEPGVPAAACGKLPTPDRSRYLLSPSNEDHPTVCPSITSQR